MSQGQQLYMFHVHLVLVGAAASAATAVLLAVVASIQHAHRRMRLNRALAEILQIPPRWRRVLRRAGLVRNGASGRDRRTSWSRAAAGPPLESPPSR